VTAGSCALENKPIEFNKKGGKDAQTYEDKSNAAAASHVHSLRNRSASSMTTSTTRTRRLCTT
jgi:hypothetical protein